MLHVSLARHANVSLAGVTKLSQCWSEFLNASHSFKTNLETADPFKPISVIYSSITQGPHRDESDFWQATF